VCRIDRRRRGTSQDRSPWHCEFHQAEALLGLHIRDRLSAARAGNVRAMDEWIPFADHYSTVATDLAPAMRRSVTSIALLLYAYRESCHNEVKILWKTCSGQTRRRCDAKRTYNLVLIRNTWKVSCCAAQQSESKDHSAPASEIGSRGSLVIDECASTATRRRHCENGEEVLFGTQASEGFSHSI
jgi:hypothetical protein